MSGCDDRGLLLGEGLFETILVRDGVPQHLEAHVDRMRRSAAALSIAMAPEVGATAAARTGEAWQAAGRPARAALRITLSAGSGRGLLPPTASTPRVEVALTRLPDVADRRPLTAVTVRAHRVDPGAAVSGHKTLSWLPWIAARREARGRGADVALVTTVDGDVCEADHANVFAVLADEVVTPSLDRGVLPGVTRARVLAVLRTAGRAVCERRLQPAELLTASEIWLTSSLDGVRPLAGLDGRALEAPGPATAWLADCMGSV